MLVENLSTIHSKSRWLGFRIVRKKLGWEAQTIKTGLHFYEFLWISMNFDDFFMNFYEFLWISMNFIDLSMSSCWISMIYALLFAIHILCPQFFKVEKQALQTFLLSECMLSTKVILKFALWIWQCILITKTSKFLQSTNQNLQKTELWNLCFISTLQNFFKIL